MSKLKVCRTCLAHNVKMYRNDQFNLEIYFQDILQIQKCPSRAVTEFFCFECASLIHKFWKFKQKIERASTLMVKYLSQYKKLSEVVIVQEEREEMGLASNLSCVKLNEDSFNAAIKKEHDITEIKEEEFEHEEKSCQIEIDTIFLQDNKSLDENYDDMVADENSNSDKLFEDLNASMNKRQTRQSSLKSKKKKCLEKFFMNAQSIIDDPENLADSEVDEPIIKSKKRSRSKLMSDSVLKKSTESETIERKLKKRKCCPQVKKQKPSKYKFSREKQKTGNKPNPHLQNVLDTKFVIKEMTDKDCRDVLERRKSTKYYLQKPYKCEKCVQSFSKQDLFDRHVGLVHDKKIGPHECDICDAYFKDRKSFKRHMVDYHVLEYKCNQCTFVCYARSRAIEHYRFKHESKKYECKICNTSYSARTTYYSHMRKTHSGGLPCPLCGIDFQNEIGLKFHMNLLHRNVQPNESGIKCCYCDMVIEGRRAHLFHVIRLHNKSGCKNCYTLFESKSDMKGHVCHELIKMKEIDESKLVCPVCNLKADNPDSFTKHIKDEHAALSCHSCLKCFITEEERSSHICSQKYVEKMIKGKMMGRPRRLGGSHCDICGITLATSTVLSEHRIAMHGIAGVTRKKKTMSCDECNAIFVSKYDLTQHMKCHTGDIMYKCEHCPEQFILKGHLKAHVLDMHAGAMPYLCSHCGTSYARQIELDRHLKLIESKKQCKFCGMTFETDELAKEHKNKEHKNVHTYKCSVCGKNCNSQGNLIVHMSSHAGIKQYGCDKCGKKYRTNNTLRIHVMTVHMKMPDPYHRNDPMKRQRSTAKATEQQDPDEIKIVQDLFAFKSAPTFK